MKKISSFLTECLPWFILGFVTMLCLVFIMTGTKAEDGSITLDGEPAKISESTKEWIESAEEAYSKIVYASKPVPALLADGSTIDVPTIESIDDPAFETKTGEGGRGSYIYAPTGTFNEFKDYTIGKCWDVDGWYGSQCVDLHNLFQMNYTKDQRWLDLCGTDAARGIWQCKEVNAGNEYELIYNASEIKTGDWIITGGGTWGHTCEAAGPYNNGYVACLGENQGGAACPNGGAATNIVNLSMGTFLGAFRPKTYVEPSPTPPEPVVSVCDRWTLQWGDTLGQVMKTCEGSITWGEAMNSYARTWVDESTGKTVYEGWITPPGIGLYAGHTIVRK